ncbi:MAG: hypothetical protein H6Q36_998 [Chloroflexi bacterium]|jgi:hypothetical protein|nr:hypothetical protein [Chloroflexota bacterium]
MTDVRSDHLGQEPPPATAAAPAAELGPAPAAPAVGGGAGPRRLRVLLVAVAGALVLPLAVAAALTWSAADAGHDHDASIAADARVVSAADMEQEYGIRVGLIGVTADGGLVDVRFTVVDSDKAGHILHDQATLPELLVETSGAVLRAPQPHAHKLTLADGATYFLLFPNSGGVIQAGTPVSFVIDAIRLEAVDAQG